MSDRVITLNDLLAAAGDDQGQSVLEIWDDTGSLYRITAVDPEVLDEATMEDLEVAPAVTDGTWTHSLQIRLECVREGRL